jgi:polyadenylate-binding protein
MKMDRMTKYQGVNLYVKNIDDTIDDERLKGEFAAYGGITSARVMRDEKGNSKGFGFVCFSSPEEATRAVTEMNTKMVGTKPLYVALAQRKEVRRAQLEAQHAQRAKGMRVLPPQVYPQGPPPVFYPQPNPAQGFVYQGQMVRGRWAGPNQYHQGMGPQPFVNVQPPVSAGPPPPGNPQAGRGRQGKQPGGPGQGRGAGRGRGQGQQGPRGPRQPHAGQPPQQPQQQDQQPHHTQPQETITDGQVPYNREQHQALGEKLYQLISALQPELAGKITGMILESSLVDEVVVLIDSAEALDAKINEALQVLAQAGIHAQ